MKTLIINGSPRKKGDTMTLVNEMVKHLKGEVKIVHTYYDNIRPCVDCRYCHTHKGCSIKDDAQEIYDNLDSYDNIVVASPLYVSELTGQLLNFASRSQQYFSAKFIRRDMPADRKKKNGVLIICAGGNTKDLEHPTRTANMIFKSLGAEPVGSAYASHTDDLPAREDQEALKKVRELALKLNQLNEEK